MELGRLVAPMTTTEARFLHPVHQRQELGDDAAPHLVVEEGREEGVGVGEKVDSWIGCLHTHIYFKSLPPSLPPYLPPYLAIGLLTLRRDRVVFIDEDDGGRVLLRLLEGLAEVALGLTGHLGKEGGRGREGVGE